MLEQVGRRIFDGEREVSGRHLGVSEQEGAAGDRGARCKGKVTHEHECSPEDGRESAELVTTERTRRQSKNAPRHSCGSDWSCGAKFNSRFGDMSLALLVEEAVSSFEVEGEDEDE